MFLLGGALVAACSSGPDTPPASLALTGLSVIDVVTGSITPDQTILADGQVIRSVGSAADAAPGIGAGTIVVDHSGRYAIPGLWDMHVHFRTGPTPDWPRAQLVAENRALLPQFVGFGITGVRDAGGDLPDEVLAWRAEIESGTLTGPRIYTALRKIDGPRPEGAPVSVSSQGAVIVTSNDEMKAALEAHVAAGADFIKFHDEWLDRTVLFEGLRIADAFGLRTAAHVRFDIPLEEMLTTGLDSAEHHETLLKAAFPDDRLLSAEFARARAAGEPTPVPGLRLADGADFEHARSVLRNMGAHEVFVTPTSHIIHTQLALTDASTHDGDEPLEQVPPGIRASYATRIAALTARAPDLAQRQSAALERTRALVATAAAEGVTILAGSDSGAGNSFVYAGDSLHAELAALVRAGLSPLQALQAATVNGARWFGAEDRHGTIAAGKAADVVVLDANPLDDIENTRALAAVTLNGHHFDAAALEGLRTLSPAVALQGVWSKAFTSRDHPAWRIDDLLCAGCPGTQYRYLQSLLAAKGSEDRSLKELDAEANRVGDEYRQGLMTEAQRDRLARYVAPADAATRCEPPHVWQIIFPPLPLSIEFRERSVVLHQHHWNVIREFDLDGGPDTGSATARFDGRSLVVETRDVAAFTMPGISFADGARIIERYTPDARGQRLEIEVTLIEPTSFREPLVLRDARVRTPNVELFDYDPCGSPFEP